MNLEEIEEVKLKSVSCSGKESPFDHPKIFLEIDPKIGGISCPYCSKHFKLK